MWRERYTERRQPRDNRGRDWSDPARSQGMSGIASHQQKVRKQQRRILSNLRGSTDLLMP